MRLLTEYTGRGAQRARTHIGPDVITIVLEDTLNTGEHRLVDDGRGEIVLQARLAFQQAMRQELVAAVVRMAEVRIRAFLSAHDIEADIAVHVFVLEGSGSRPGHGFEAVGRA